MTKAIVIADARPSAWARALFLGSLGFALLSILLLTSTL